MICSRRAHVLLTPSCAGLRSGGSGPGSGTNCFQVLAHQAYRASLGRQCLILLIEGVQV